jgi:hypothetical protein
MRAARLLPMLLLTVLGAGAASAASLSGSVFLMPISQDANFSSHGSATYYDDLNNVEYTAVLSGTHSVQGPYVFSTSVYGNGSYSYTLQGPTQPGACYGTSLSAQADPPGFLPYKSGSWSGGTQCAPQQQAGGCENVGNTCDQTYACPLVLDLNDDGIHTTSLDDPVWFWIDMEGQNEATAWTNPQTEEAFLWMDLNHDHVTQVTELFGSRMMGYGSYYANGFVALLRFDRPAYGGNLDGQITQQDAVWHELRLWVDRNHDSVSQPAEISVPSSHGIVALNLGYVPGNSTDEHGNELYLVGSYEKRVPGGGIELRTMADVEFRYIPNP